MDKKVSIIKNELEKRSVNGTIKGSDILEIYDKYGDDGDIVQEFFLNGINKDAMYEYKKNKGNGVHFKVVKNNV